MGLKLAIENRVCVPLKGKLASSTKASAKRFDFTLDMERMDQDQITEAVGSGGAIVDFVVDRTKGWDGQRLVLNDDNSPAEFSEEALRMLLKLPGMAVWCYQAYLREVGVQEKN